MWHLQQRAAPQHDAIDTDAIERNGADWHRHFDAVTKNCQLDIAFLCGKLDFAEAIRELAVDRPAGERFDLALKEAKRLRQHVLVVFLHRDAALTESWFRLRLEDRPMRAKLPDYQLIQVDVASKGAASLADRIGVTRQTIHSIEKGRYSPSVGLALQLAALFGVRVEDLFELEKGQGDD